MSGLYSSVNVVGGDGGGAFGGRGDAGGMVVNRIPVETALRIRQ